MSTGPHLHFGLYRGKTAINPESVVKVVKSELSLKNKQAFNNMKTSFVGTFDNALSQNHQNAPKEEWFENYMPLM